MTSERDKVFVFDNNVFIAAAINPRGCCAKALALAESSGLLISSENVANELFDKMTGEKIRSRIPLWREAFFTRSYYAGVKMITVTPSIQSCKDIKDNMFLDLAVTGKADVIVSGDKDLRDMKNVKGRGHIIPIIAVGQFLAQYPAPAVIVPGPFSSFFRSARPE